MGEAVRAAGQLQVTVHTYIATPLAATLCDLPSWDVVQGWMELGTAGVSQARVTDTGAG